MIITLRQRLLATTLFAAAGLGAPTLAQTSQPAVAKPTVTAATAAETSEIVVTGSRISRPDLKTSSPVTVVGQQEITLRQATTAEELLRDLPSVRPSLGPGVNNGSDGSASINLRGIGENRTLVLIDGRRIVPFGLDGLTDTNVIPIALIDRVDVVTGGASSVYGADAVAGVVNFITKRNFTGVDLSGSYRITERGDAKRYSGDLLIGADSPDGKGNVVIGIGYQNADPLLHTSRDISQFPRSSGTGLFNGSTNSVPTIFTSPGNAALGLAASPIGGAAFDPATGLLRPATAADTFNTNLGTYFQTPLEKWNIYAAGHYEITDGVEAYATGMFTRNKVTLQLAPSGTFTNTYQLALNNAYLPVGVRNQLCTARSITAANCATAAAVQGGPGTPGYIEVPVIAQRRFVEYGYRGNPVESTQFQVQAGLRGSIIDNLAYDVSAQYGETQQNQSRENWGSFSKVQQALRSYRTPAGALLCADQSNGCVPLNLFGAAGSITPAQTAFIDLDARIQRKTQLAVITGNINGDLFGLASPFATSAPVAFSIGGEYRKIKAKSLPDGPSQIQGEVLGAGARTPPDMGEYNVKEAFGELIVPLVRDKPFFYDLTLEAGIRYSDYSTTGGSTTWKAGGSYTPIEGFKLRSVYQVAVRSPNISELYQSPVQGLGNLAIDPCQALLPVGNAGLTALCIATGAPAGSIGSIPSPSSSQINVTTSGNRNLDVERAKTFTVGAVLTPTFLRGVSLTIDYFRIKVADAITTPAQGDILNGCYQTALNPSLAYNGFCQLIGRNPLNGGLNGSGETPGVILGGSNLGVIKTAGIDIGFSAKQSLDIIGIENASLSFSFNGTWLDYYNFQATPNSINRDCTGYYSTNCTNPRPEYKWNSRVTVSKGAFDLSLLWNHISSVKLEPFNATAITPLSTPQPGGPNPAGVFDAYERIGAYDTFDLAGHVVIGDHLELTLTVDNLLDKAPPAVGSTIGGTAFNSGNTFPTTYDILGRTFTIGARLKF